MDTNEYLLLFPDAKIICESLRFEYGKGARRANPMHDPLIAAKVSAALTGIPKSVEHKEKLSVAKTGKSWGSHSEEHKDRMRIISKENMEKRLQEGWRPPIWTEERKLAHANFMLNNTNGKNGNHNKGKTLALTDGQRKNRSRKRVEYLVSNASKSVNTSIELKCRDFLIANDIQFEQQFILETAKSAWAFDFFIPKRNLLIEVDGEYWHRKPKQINRDILKSNAASDAGFILLRLSSDDLNFELIFEDNDIIAAWSQSVLTSRIRS